jgi:hypothetical protein
MFPLGKIGDAMRLHIPAMDLDRDGPWNMLAVILEVESSQLYKWFVIGWFLMLRTLTVKSFVLLTSTDWHICN